MGRKRTGRAARRDEVVANIRDVAGDLQALVERHESAVQDLDKPDDEESEEFKKLLSETLEEAEDILGNADISDLESLRDEIEEWRSNIEEKFSATQKYSDLGDCYDALESAISELEDAVNSTFDAIDDITDTADRLESGADLAEQAEFPGMYG